MNQANRIDASQERAIAVSLISAIPPDLSVDAAIRWSNSRNLLIERVGAILRDDGSRAVPAVLDEWKTIYGEVFGIKVDFSSLAIPRQPPGLTRLAVRSKDVSRQAVMAACESLFPTSYHPLGEFGDDLDAVLTDNHRPDHDYAFWVRDVGEAEVAPFADMDQAPIPRMTLLERLLLEIKYYSETGLHLDSEKVTYCGGSRHVEGNERPVVCHRQGKVQVFWQASAFVGALMSCSPYWSRQMAL